MQMSTHTDPENIGTMNLMLLNGGKVIFLTFQTSQLNRNSDYIYIWYMVILCIPVLVLIIFNLGSHTVQTLTKAAKIVK